MTLARSVFVVAISCLVACGGGGGGKDDPACGNGVVEGAEGCDDGNLLDGDGCSAACIAATCGDGVRDFNEACDDGNQANGDGCDTNCTESYCGNGLKSDDEMCDDGNRVDGDGCDNNCRPTGCGNGAKAGTEECDDGNEVQGDGCDNNCTTSACGNGVMAGDEECDDGNTAGLDGCSAVCTTEIAEIEPNDDGTPSTGGSGIDGNDFGTTGADANGPIMTSTTRVAKIDPAGDEDVWAFTNPGTASMTVKFDVWNVAAGYGIGVPCGESIDTGMHIRDAAGNSLASNDDRDGGDDRCSVISFGLLAGETRYVHVIAYGDEDVIPSYALQVTYTPVACGNGATEIGEQCDDMNTMNGDGCDSMCQIEVVCGDGVVHPGEQCDDMNTMNGDGCDSMCQIEVVCGDGVLQPTEQCDDMNTMAGDGCSATCQLEGAVAEVEPNEDGTPSTGGTTIDGNDFGSTHADTNGAFTTNTTIAAAITPAGDEDVFKITNTSATMVALHLDVWNVGPGYSIGMPCGTSIDTGMHVRNAAGVSLASNDDRDGANDRCSTLTYPLAPGATVYAHVSDYADDDAIGAYALVVQFDPIVCGDGAVGAGEQCDDTNTMNGDGCSSTCQFELVEMEPNDDGSVSMGGSGTVGNDFSSTAANGPYNHSVIIAAAMAVAGDEDVFAFTNPGANAVSVKFDIWNLDFGYGVGAACDTSIDTGLHIRNATGMSLADNDDRDGADDRCSGLTYSIAAGATVYVHVVDYDDDDTITSYALQAVYQ